MWIMNCYIDLDNKLRNDYLESLGYPVGYELDLNPLKYVDLFIDWFNQERKNQKIEGRLIQTKNKVILFETIIDNVICTFFLK